MSCYQLAISPQQRDVLVRILRAAPAETMPDEVAPLDTHQFADMLETMIPSYEGSDPKAWRGVLNGLCL